MDFITLTQKVQPIAKVFARHNKELALVGGCVRDILMGHKPKDIDLTTNATPEEMKSMFKNIIGTGEKYGTMTVMYGDVGHEEAYEITTYRLDGNYSDGRKPDEVVFADNITDDLLRRDFTINAVAINAINGEIIDPYNGVDDICTRTLRFIGSEKRNSFEEDGLRIMRAIRFAFKYSLLIDPNIAKLLTKDSTYDMLDKVSNERIRDELTKILPNVSFDNFIGAYPILFCLMRKLLSNDVFDKALYCKQNKYHVHNVWDHCWTAMAKMRSSDWRMKLAALLHDISKPDCKTIDTKGDVHFYQHQVISARFARKWLREFKFSSSDIEFISNIIHEHMYFVEDMSPKAIRRFVRNNAGKFSIDQWIQMRMADKRAGKNSDKNLDQYEASIRFKIFKAVYSGADISSGSSLAIDGNDVIEIFNLKPCKAVGDILNLVEEYVLEYPNKNTAEDLKLFLEKERENIETSILT